jgi:uncharacterized protein YbbK (DUF523 family)
MEIGPVLLDAGTHPCEERTRDRRSILREACPEHEIGLPRSREPDLEVQQGWDQAGRTLVSASDITVAAPWQNWAWAVVPMMPRLVR